RRRASGKDVEPARRMSCSVITKTEAGSLARGLGFLETDVTRSLASSSRDKSARVSVAREGRAMTPIVSAEKNSASVKMRQRPSLSFRRPGVIFINIVMCSFTKAGFGAINYEKKCLHQ